MVDPKTFATHLLLTPEIASAFVARPGVDLRRFDAITEGAAAILAEWPDRLDLDGISSLTAEAAACLARHSHILSLSGLDTLPSEVARHLANHRGPGLSLESVWMLEDEATAHLARHRGSLNLDGLTGISDASAVVLAKHAGPISLCGLYSLSTRAARALASRGCIATDGSDDPLPLPDRNECVLGTPALTPKGADLLSECFVEVVRFDAMGQDDPEDFICQDGQYLCYSQGEIIGIPAYGPSGIMAAIEYETAGKVGPFKSTAEVLAAYGPQGIRLVVIDSLDDEQYDAHDEDLNDWG